MLPHRLMLAGAILAAVVCGSDVGRADEFDKCMAACGDWTSAIGNTKPDTPARVKVVNDHIACVKTCAGNAAASRYSVSSSPLGPDTAGDCDFGKPVGSCVGRIDIKRTSGSSGSYSAVLEIRSSAPRCSRVEYFVDNTPHITVFNNGNSDTDNIFGTKPITLRDINVSKCVTFESLEKR